jgi:HAD superfamily hydrolase (TIGR01509 family)
MPAAALFDWDGTLIDSRDALLAAWHASTDAVLGRRFPVTPDEEELVFTLPGAELFPRVAGDADGAAALSAAFQEAYTENAGLVRAFPGVREMLGELRAAGVAVGVVTSKARPRFDHDAERAGLDALVDVGVCQGDTEAHKPDPAPVLRALEELGVGPEDAVMAGDTPVDVAAGAGAGVAVLGVAWGAGAPDALLGAGAAAVARDTQELTRMVLDRVPEGISS